jgi:DNA-binding transcriptional regulator LsrR (DeoR family)
MTKQEASKAMGISRPTLDAYLKDKEKRNIVLFVMSFTAWEFFDRLSRIKLEEMENGENSKQK